MQDNVKAELIFKPLLPSKELTQLQTINIGTTIMFLTFFSAARTKKNLFKIKIIRNNNHTYRIQFMVKKTYNGMFMCNSCCDLTCRYFLNKKIIFFCFIFYLFQTQYGIKRITKYCLVYLVFFYFCLFVCSLIYLLLNVAICNW